MRAWAKKKFTYNGIELGQGQVFELVEARNDQKLLWLNFCEEVKKKTEVIDCTCGLSFVGESCLRSHQAGKMHPKKTVVLSSV